MKPIKVKYISEKPSPFFDNGSVYDAYMQNQSEGKLIVFYFSAEQMDEEGYYGFPASMFEVVK